MTNLKWKMENGKCFTYLLRGPVDDESRHRVRSDEIIQFLFDDCSATVRGVPQMEMITVLDKQSDVKNIQSFARGNKIDQVAVHHPVTHSRQQTSREITEMACFRCKTRKIVQSLDTLDGALAHRQI